MTLRWTVTNIGQSPSASYSWTDAAYLSSDNIWDPSDQLIKTWAHAGNLSAGQSYNSIQSTEITNGISGNYYVLIITDFDKQNPDNDLTNNIAFKNIYVKFTSPPDLVISNFVVPAEGTSGQPFMLKWSVTNQGPGTTRKGFVDKFYLSSDLVPDNSDIVLGIKNHDDLLASGISYEDSLRVFIPVNAIGNMIVIGVTDDGNKIYEHVKENNNIVTTLINIIKPLPSDLIVTTVTGSDSVTTGQNITINWTVKNVGQNPASGVMKQAAYFSSDTTWDITDVLITIQETSVNLPPLSTKSYTTTDEVQGVGVGNFYVLVRTDVVNNIVESADSNNTRYSDNTVFISVPELPINVLTNANLKNNRAIYYRIEVPDSLATQALLITLKGDSLSGANELYTKFGNVPTRAVHDFSHDKPFSGNQELIIPSMKKGTYYLMVYGSSPMNTQPIKLLARVLPFEIRSIEAKKGGNTGKVTVLIKGAKFEPDMRVSLISSQGDTLDAVKLLLVNTIKGYATFNLKGVATGMYHVYAKNSSGETTMMINGFEVVPGGPPDLSVDVRGPGSSAAGRGLTMSIDFQNTGDVDIDFPSVLLKSTGGAPVALTAAGLKDGIKQMVVPLKESGAASGTLRPGAKGSIIIYSFSSSGLGFTVDVPTYK